MAKGVSIQVEGLDQLIKKLGSIPDKVSEAVDVQMAVEANDFVNRAVQDAPVDQGILRNEISMDRLALMDYKVVSGASWSAYIEFGTRGRVQVPPELAEYASQFKGSGGGKKGEDVKHMIFEWCRRKGIDKKMWFPIFISIMTKGIHPHPYFFIQMPIAQENLNRDLKEVVQNALR